MRSKQILAVSIILFISTLISVHDYTAIEARNMFKVEENKKILLEQYSKRRDFLYQHLTRKYRLDLEYTTAIFDRIEEKAVERGWSPDLLLAICEGESNFKHMVKSNKASIGLFQVHSPTWTKRLIKLGMISSEKDLYDPMINIDCGVYILEVYLKLYKGNIKKALGGYAGKYGYHESVFSRIGYYNSLIPSREEDTTTVESEKHPLVKEHVKNDHIRKNKKRHH
jgi:hypothetical protein